MGAKIAFTQWRWRVSTMDLTDEPWEVLKPILPVPPRRADGRGRPWRAPRAVLNGMRWLLRTGAPWKDLPSRDPPSHTGPRRFPRWGRSGGLDRSLRALAAALHERGGLELSACVIDGTLVVATKGGAVWARPRGAKG